MRCIVVFFMLVYISEIRFAPRSDMGSAVSTDMDMETENLKTRIWFRIWVLFMIIFYDDEDVDDFFLCFYDDDFRL